MSTDKAPPVSPEQPMPSPAAVGGIRLRSMVAVALAYVAGFVDTVGFYLAHVYTSHVTGNLAATGRHLAEGHWYDMVVHALPVAMFVAGAAAGALLAETAARKPIRALVAPGLGLEVVLLGVLLGLGGHVFTASPPSSRLDERRLVAVNLAALAMGVQTVTFRRIGGMTVRTTFMTGMLTNLAEEAVDLLLSRRARRDRTLFTGSRQPSLRRIGILGTLWIGFLLGAISGVLGAERWQQRAFTVPIGLLIILGLLDCYHPYGGPVDSPARRRVHRWRSGE